MILMLLSDNSRALKCEYTCIIFCPSFFHWKLSKWQVSVQPMTNISIKIITFLFNLSPPGQNGHHFADDTFKCIFLNENVRISIKISLKFVPKGPIDNKAALVQVMAWRSTGDKPLPESMLTQFTDAYMRHYGRWVKWVILGIKLSLWKGLKWSLLISAGITCLT